MSVSPLVAAFERLAARGDAGLEAAIEALYAAAVHAPRSASTELEAVLARHADRLPAVAAWRALVRLRLARGAARGEALRELDAALARAPARTRWIAGVEAARLVEKRVGAAEAWARVRDLAPFVEEDAWREGPMAISAVLVWLRLAGAAGDLRACDAIARIAAAAWPEGSPPSIRVGLLIADQAIQRGRFREALDRVAALEPAAQGDLRVHLLCTRLHALAALGRGGRPLARRTYRAIRRALRESSDDHLLPASERRAIGRRADRIARQAGIVTAGRGRGGSILVRLLDLEQQARGMRRDREAKVRLLFAVLERADAALSRPGPVTDVEAWLRLRLLRCRVIVDLAAHELFDDCVGELARIHEEAARRGLLPVAMLALDLRAIVQARAPRASFRGVVEDSARAASLAVEIVAANAGAERAVERALLADLLPVFDRAIDLHAEGALRVARRHPALLAEPIQRYAEARDAETPEGTWLRFGRVLHAYAEQTQALALEEARRAYEAGRASPARLAIAAEGPPRVVVDDLSAALPERDGVLQYLVVGRHLLVFLFGRGFFDWHAQVLLAQAHDALTVIVQGIRAFTLGALRGDERASIAALHEVLLPPKIRASIEAADLRHLRIVPHDVLYRVPFGKLALGRTTLAERFSLSLHPTGRVAVAAAPEGPRGAASIGHVTGPDVGCAEDEARAIRIGVGRLAPLGVVSPIDTVVEGLAALRARALAHDVLHFTCHGAEGDALSPPVLRLGDPRLGALDLAGAAALRLRPRALVVLQSCWTGWMDHDRANPVQGFPQAFCDAGAAAVIAPLVPLPEALAPFFSNVLYRALRFLPAEQALHRTLEVLRAHGRALVAGHPEAIAKLVEHGSVDAFEYRYAGAVGLRFGGLLARAAGRASFWWWLRRITRGGGGAAGQPGSG